MVELSAVNRSVVGSNPACGAYGRLSEWPRRSTIWKSYGLLTRSRGFESLALRHQTSHNKWPVGQAVKTPPFHGSVTGSNPVRVTILFSRDQSED